MDRNHPFATHLRIIVQEALNLVLDKGVPNAIPCRGLIVTIKIKPDLRKLLKRSAVKQWTRVGDLDGHEVYFVPAWELLRFADEVDKLANDKWLEAAQEVE